MTTLQNKMGFYQSKADAVGVYISVLKARSRKYMAGNIASFMAAIVCLVLLTVTAAVWWQVIETVLAILFFLLYLFVRMRDVRNDEAIRHEEDRRQVYLNELIATTGRYAQFDDGKRYADPHHAYTFDLDIFGPDSLYQRLCRTATTGGSDAIAMRLSSLDGRPPLRTYDEAYRRHIEELARDEAFRTEFISYGVREKIDTRAISNGLKQLLSSPLPRAVAHPAVLALVWLNLLCFYAVIIMAVMGKVSAQLPVLWGILQFSVVFACLNRTMAMLSAKVTSLHHQLARLSELAKLIAPAEAGVFGELKKFLDGLDKRGNIMGLLIVNSLGLYDFFLLRRFARWRSTMNLDSWTARIIRTDEDVTVATLLYNNPHTCWPVWVKGSQITFEARGIYHPFLGEKAVRNNFSIANRNFYIVTGANMAGKSTFLRAVGVNYILATAGMPVFAEELKISAFRLFSSMRTSDDLAHGISYFNAELLRLQQLINYCKPAASDGSAQQGTLLILDEILKGTNSLDKLNGSRMFLKAITGYPVSGIIATHDLELSKMAGEDDRFHNCCFEIELGQKVTYSYKITDGVAANQNATYLLRSILNDV